MMTGNHRSHTKRRPFWLPASNFYFLASAMAIGIFFLVWLLLQEIKDETPWITAGLVTSLFLIATVILREIILRNARNRIVAAQHKLDRTLAFAPRLERERDPAEKFTIERNAAFLAEIKRKSDAANVLSSVAGSHREVFELCSFYIDLVDRELPMVGFGSPRIAALTQGRERAVHRHKYHMLKWAELEVVSHSIAMSQAPNSKVSIENGMKALGVLEAALSYYPQEGRLIDSETAIRDHLNGIKVRELVKKAENALSGGEPSKALRFYKNARKTIENSAGWSTENRSIAEHVESEIGRLEKQ